MFSIFTGDITKLKCDVIVNSLGVKTTDYGGICGSVVKAAKSEELVKIIERANGVYDIGEFFFTEGYSIPVTAICHLITPHKDSDDKNMNILIYSVKNVLMHCKKLGYKHIGLPLIGTGANSYNEDAVFDIFKNMCGSFCDYFPSMSVTIVVAEDSIKNANHLRLIEAFEKRGGQYHDSEVIKEFKKSTSYFKKYYQYDDRIITFDKKFFNRASIYSKDERRMHLQGIDSVRAYINEYIDSKFDGKSGDKAKKDVYGYLGYGKSNPIASGKNTFNNLNTSGEKKTFFKLCLAVRMDYQDASDFLNYFGYSFANANVSKTDELMRSLLLRHIYGVVEVNNEFIRIGLPPLFK